MSERAPLVDKVVRGVHRFALLTGLIGLVLGLLLGIRLAQFEAVQCHREITQCTLDLQGARAFVLIGHKLVSDCKTRLDSLSQSSQAAQDKLDMQEAVDDLEESLQRALRSDDGTH